MARLGVRASSFVISSNETIQHSAESGLGIALLPAEAVGDAIRRRTLVQVPTEATPLVRPWHLVVRAGEQLGAALLSFVAGLVTGPDGFGLTAEGAAALGTGV